MPRRDEGPWGRRPTNARVVPMAPHRVPARTRLLAAVVAVLALLAAGCGDDDDTTTDATTTSSSSSTTSTTSTTTTSTSSTTTSSLPSGPTEPIPDDQLPGEAFDLTPAAGSVLAVVGVEHDDVLNVREGPGVDNGVISELAPTSVEAVATGRGRLLDESIWWEVTLDDGTIHGWVHSRFTAQIGPTGDITAQIVADLGTLPNAATMDELADLVIGTLAIDSEVPTTVTLTVAPTTGDLTEATYDVLGFGDDALYGLRLHIFASSADAPGLALKTVEATDLCVAPRGVSQPSGLCA